MMTLEELKKNRSLINAIDWDMTPEEAVRLYLEWGNNWSRGNYVIKSKHDVSHYFVLNTWDEKPVIFLIRRNSEEASELVMFYPPHELMDGAVNKNRGVYAVEGEIRNWLMEQLDAA